MSIPFSAYPNGDWCITVATTLEKCSKRALSVSIVDVNVLRFSFSKRNQARELSRAALKEHSSSCTALPWASKQIFPKAGGTVCAVFTAVLHDRQNSPREGLIDIFSGKICTSTRICRLRLFVRRNACAATWLLCCLLWGESVVGGRDIRLRNSVLNCNSALLHNCSYWASMKSALFHLPWNCDGSDSACVSVWSETFPHWNIWHGLARNEWKTYANWKRVKKSFFWRINTGLKTSMSRSHLKIIRTKVNCAHSSSHDLVVLKNDFINLQLAQS